MAQPVHSLGPTCAFYYADPHEETAETGLRPPKVKAQFFYVSSVPIDDPLSPVPPASADKATDLPPQPFSAKDNAALEESWQAFQPAGEELTEEESQRRRNLATGIYSFSHLGDGTGSRSMATQPVVFKGDATLRGRTTSSAKVPRAGSQVMLDQKATNPQRTKPVDSEELRESTEMQISSTSDAMKPRRRSPFHRQRREGKKSRDSSLRPRELDTAEQTASQSSFEPLSDISGRPFARARSGRNLSTPLTFQSALSYSDASDTESRSRSRGEGRRRRKENEDINDKAFVPVGISKLHLVEMPDLVMKPIYWSPINDTSTVMRATWFFKDTMLPLPIDVANRLEAGYEYMQPFGPSYQDELQACIDNGPSAEIKVVYKLWSHDPKSSRPSTGLDMTETNLKGPQRSKESPGVVRNAGVETQSAQDKRLFATHSVIFTDARNAQILKPNLLPSVSKNRRPLGALRKGRQIGVAVVRGFDRKEWLKIHPDPTIDAKVAHAKVGAYISQSGDATTRARRMSCAACDQSRQRPKVGDLVLVIHGIGQKLSERVDSYHFTHAINGLRREFNVELATETVKGNLRQDTGIMVLPVNWRLTLSFDEDIKTTSENSENKFALKDITPETLPAVRSVISDVMLDIPYYMSHHKEKMISAVIREANRVYRLWCRNNPGFEDFGRVHLIAHSLGSVMAMEILGRQPTHVGKDTKLDPKMPSDKFFEFDTTNLFNCGSPSGFFLLLNNANLIPRKGRDKPGMEGEDRQPGIADDAKYGCLATDNIYNIVHRNDPISYLQNAIVDELYARSLQTAIIPSAGVSFMTRVGKQLRWASSTAGDAYAAIATPPRPGLQQMPSTVELDTHHFSREAIAEKRMYLLNENGQIDWFLSAGGGPLEFQYLNMLSAHSSYWLLQDFVRFLVVEIGREPGRENTLPALRAVKKREYKRGNINE